MSEDAKAGLSIRINLHNGGRFGPGKAALLRAILEHGSISKAVDSLSMSYPRALKLIEEMNTDFQGPLVISSHGGAKRGGSALSETGETVLAAYDAVCTEATTAARAILEKLTSMS